MRLFKQTNFLAFVQRILPAATLAAAFTLASVPLAYANDDDCRGRTEKAEHKLHEAIEHHGYSSSQANHWRHKLQEARERCWKEQQQWWNMHENRWHHDRDWDDHDHDHDRDHDHGRD